MTHTAAPFLRSRPMRFQRALAAWGLLAGMVGCQCYQAVGQLKSGVRMIAPPGKDTEFERTIVFPPQRLTTPADQPIQLHNLSRVTATVTVQLDTTAADSFCLQLGPKKPCVVPGVLSQPMDLTAGADFYWTIRYLPTQVRSDEATITVKTTSSVTPQYIVHVKGSGAQSKIDVCSTDDSGGEICASTATNGQLVIDFGKVAPGVTPVPTKPLVIKNQGTLKMLVSSIAPTSNTSPEFTVGPDHGPVNVDTSQKADYSVGFSPLYGGPHEGLIEIDSDDPGNPSLLVKVIGVGDAAALCFTPSPPAAVDFGEVSINTTAHQPLVVTSCGTKPATLTSMTLDTGVDSAGTAATVFGSTNLPTSAQVLQPGDQVTIDMTFLPTALDTYTGHVYVTYTTELGETRGAIVLRGAGIGCTLVAPASVNFATVSVGGMGSRVVNVQNMGTSPCTITGASTASPFGVGSTIMNPTTLDSGDQLPITVNFSPTAIGPASGTLTVDSNALTPVTVHLQGTGQTAPPCDLQAQPGAVMFTNSSQGVTATQNVIIKNFGTHECDIEFVKVTPGANTGPADFAATIANSGPVNFAPVSLMPMQSVAMKTTFTPTSSNQESANIEVDYCDSNSNNPSCHICPILGNCSGIPNIIVPASGGATPGKVCVDPPSLDFMQVAPGQSKDLGFTIRSCGAGSLTLRGVKFEAGSSRRFSMSSPVSAAVILTPGQTRQVNVHYAPTNTAGDFGQVAVLSNDPADPKVLVPLKGNLTVSCDKQLICNPNFLVFPTMETGRTASLSLVCTSVGSQAVTVNGVSFMNSSTAFNGTVGRTPAVVPSGGTIRVQVDYTPAVAGTDTGTITLNSDACMAPTADLQGTGRTPNYPPCLPPQNFQPVVKWNWTGAGANQPQNNNVAMSPIVVNLTDDNGDGRIDVNDTPEVLFTTCSADKCAKLNLMDQSMSDISGVGMLRAVHGKDGSSYFDITSSSLALAAVTQLATGDLDGDNIPEIIAVKHTFHPGSGMGGFNGKYIDGTLLVFDNAGHLEFETDHWTGDPNAGEFGSAPAIADLDGDGHPEIVFERTVFHYDGTKWYDMDRSGNWGHGAFPTLADIDGDGQAEIISGAYAYRADGHLLWKAGTTTMACDPTSLTACIGFANGGTSGLCDPIDKKCMMYSGPTMVLDVNGDGTPEVILRDGSQSVHVLKGTDGSVMASATWPAIPQGSNGEDNGICPAAMSAADLDGDGGAEIIIPAGNFLYVYKYDGSTTLQQLWTYPIDDYGGQCGASGSAAFDFSGDGKYDVVYHDTTHFWVFKGTDGSVLYDAPRSSETIFETPVIADVDNDGHADMLVTNEGGPLGSTLAGVRALSNSGNTWPATRRIWSDHAYHITEISDDGTVPRVEAPPTRNNNSWRAQAPLCTH